jgi:circadian clock protein KaiB
MSQARKAKLRPDKRPHRHYLLRLFMAGHGPNSRLALTNLRQLCEKHLKGHYIIEAIDVVKNFEEAVKNNILVTPALILVSPLPSVVVLGNLSDRQKVLLALRLPEGEP